MGDAEPSKRWRYSVGLLNCLVGGLFLTISAFASVGFVQLLTADEPRAMTAGLWALYTGGVGGALLWIGIGDLRDRRRPTWIVRLALYVCVVAIAIPMTFVARETVYKQRAIENLRRLGEAVQKYDATYRIPPAIAPSQQATAPP